MKLKIYTTKEIKHRFIPTIKEEKIWLNKKFILKEDVKKYLKELDDYIMTWADIPKKYRKKIHNKLIWNIKELK